MSNRETTSGDRVINATSSEIPCLLSPTVKGGDKLEQVHSNLRRVRKDLKSSRDQGA